MGKSSDFEYLDEERKKLWHKVNTIETELSKRIDDEIAKIPEDYVGESRQASRKVSEFKNKSEESKIAILNHLTDVENTLGKIKDYHHAIEILNKKIKDDAEEADVINKSLNEVFVGVKTSREVLDDDVEKLDALFEDFDGLSDKLSKLQDIVSESDETASKIDTLHKGLLIRKKDIDQVYYDIFGYIETEDGSKTQVQGLKDQLEKSYNKLTNDVETSTKTIENLTNNSKSEYEALRNEINNNAKEHLSNWDIDYRILKTKIEALLPNALTAGLSSAYSEKKNVEISEYKKLNNAFLVAIGGLVFVSLLPLGVSYFSITQGKPFEKVLLDMPRLVLSILPLYIPVLWVAYSSNRKMNLSKRLSEEYSHKEVLSKTFEGLSTQINNIPDQKVSIDLQNKLLYNILEVSSENPGKLISDYNKSDHPLMDALDKSVKLATAYEKLGKMPGFAKLASKMNKKANAILTEEDNKATVGLESIEDEEQL